MIVLKIIGWILLSILVLVMLLLCVKVRIVAEYSEVDTHVLLKWLFLKIPLYPAKKKEKKKEEPPAEEEAAEETPEETTEEAPGTKKDSLLKVLYKSHGIEGIKLILKRTFDYLGTFTGKLLRSIFVIDELYVDVGCTRNDAAATAIYYGEVCSALFPMFGSLISQCKVKKYDINIYPDYIARHSRSAFYVSAHLVPIYLIGITLALVFKLLFGVIMKVLIKMLKYNKNKPASPGKGSAAAPESQEKPSGEAAPVA